MKVLALTLLVTLIDSVLLGSEKGGTPLKVSISFAGNTLINTTILNTGPADLKILTTGTILGDEPTEKAKVFQDDKMIPFKGARLHIDLESLPVDAFQILAAGKSVEKTFDIAETHILDSGGYFGVTAEGDVAFAEINSTEIAGVISFSSNTVFATIQGVEASRTRMKFLKRAMVQSDCTGSRHDIVKAALQHCYLLSSNATSQATFNESRLTEFFKSSTSNTSTIVSNVFRRVASECSSAHSGISHLYCTDVYSSGICASGVIAYTVPGENYHACCDYFFENLPATSRRCYAQTQASIILHEVTHLNQIGDTLDYSTYGYAGVRRLNASQNLNHADTYTLFAQSYFAGC